MRTTLIDNSLCVLPLRDDADPEDIYSYICALADAGVGYVELDFRTMMKLDCLPACMKYILRPIDPIFMALTERYKFDYIALSIKDIRGGIKTDTPVMLTLPVLNDFMTHSPREVVRYSRALVNGHITALRIRGAFPVMSYKEIAQYLDLLTSTVLLPVDICPTNEKMSAAGNAVNFSVVGADCVTVTMGSSANYCSLEEYFTLFITTMRGLPKKFDIKQLVEAAKLHAMIFQTGFTKEFDRLVSQNEDDLYHLVNAESGLAVYNEPPNLAGQEEEINEVFSEAKKADFSIFNGNKRGGRFHAFLN